ncbi:MAG: alanine racemase [Candidatus Omnitrophica bacterium]|nr:alanine racemase [Candidatus Omnitrophota bacterium]MCF7876758.1 alanine racemase [Candidatus Omnitrophota bacterium]MCF7878202.1 alanine racemase [Candidatus Omnitrophota bacterium]MCF7892674.1 alanine racemase [Candidatus Omnitrophota bacterium]
MRRQVWVNIDLEALSANVRKIKSIVGSSVKILAVLKQSAYGHGIIPVARKLYEEGVDVFGVGSIGEAIQLREDGYQGQIILLSIVSKGLASFFIRFGITPTVVDLSFARELDRQAKKIKRVIPVHIKVDTGMGRLGFYPDQIYPFLEKIKKFSSLSLEGLYTHFPVADTNSNFTNRQLNIFQKLIKDLKRQNISFNYYHSANSLGVINYPNSYLNMVRPGLILYGIKPSADSGLELKPVLSFKARIIFIKEISPGKTVGYGSEFVAKKHTRIATVSVGYADGYPWALSNCAKVLIKGKVFNIAGRVCMDHIMIDLGQDKGIKKGDIVTLIGKGQDRDIKAEDLAAWAQTIPYEIVTRISREIPRHYSAKSTN